MNHPYHDFFINYYSYSALTPCQYNDTFNMKKPSGYYRSPIDRTASYYTYICASQSIRLFRSEIYSLNEPDPDICVFICIQFFFFRFPGQSTVCLLILSNQINNRHLQVKNITKLPVLEIISLYIHRTYVLPDLTFGRTFDKLDGTKFFDSRNLEEDSSSCATASGIFSHCVRS